MHDPRLVTNKEQMLIKKLGKIHILLMDSSAQVTALFKRMLGELGFSSVYEANNSLQGVQILREIKIHLIITDWELKIPMINANQAADALSHQEILPLSGIDFVRRLRMSPASPNPFIPVIMFADAVEEMQVYSARDAGVNEICLKPLGAEQLCQRLMAVIDSPRMFITASTYRGPCRRRKAAALPPNASERRKQEVRIIKSART